MSTLESIDRRTAQGGPVDGYLVTTESRKYFITAGDAYIIRLDMPFSPSGKWLARAVYSSRNAYLSR